MSKAKKAQEEDKPCLLICCLGLLFIVLIFGAMLIGVIDNPFLPRNGDNGNGETTTTTTTHPDGTTTTTTHPTTTDTPPTTTTPITPDPPKQYIIRFQFAWGPDIPEEDKCNLEFFAYDTDGTTLRDSAAFSKNAINVWYPGELDEIFTEGEQVEIQMEAYQTWHDMTEWVTITVGPTSHFLTFYSYKFGFSASMTSELRINWELI